jgi:hypothetical protein
MSALALAFAWSACGQASPPPRMAQVREPRAPQGVAFVVYTAAGTTILPLDTSPRRRTPGLWVLDDESRRVTAFFEPAQLDLPDCACESGSDACRYEQALALEGEREPICRCAPRRAIYEAEEPRARYRRRRVPVSLTGGTLFVYEHGYGLAERWSMRVDTIALAPQSAPLGSPPLASCDPRANVHPLDPWLSTASTCTLSENGWTASEHDADCADCGGEGGATLSLLHRGALYSVTDRPREEGIVIRVVESAPARADTCPSHADPCGDPARFPAIEEADEFWIATDWEAALRIDDGEASLLYRGERIALGPIEGPILGVRFHHDTRPLEESIRDRAPAPRAPVSVCGADLECIETAGCDAFCTNERRCARASEGACNAEHACPLDVTCVEGECRLLPVVDPNDRGVTDARELGRRCVQHLDADRLPQALAACDAALHATSVPSERAIFHHMIGRMFVLAHDRESACASFRSANELEPSLRARTPGIPCSPE